ncbi:MAG: TRAP transporter small permease [Sphaerochaetaceae bacterium]
MQKNEQNTRFSQWLDKNHLVPDKANNPGSKMIGEMLRVINHWTHKIMLYIAEIALALMVVLVFMTVVLRYCFNTGIGWAEEVPRLLVTLFAFLACAIGVRDHMHISVNVVYNLFPRNGVARKILDVFSDVCVMICGIFLLVCGWQRVALLMNMPGTLPMTGWPTWIQYVPAPMAGFLMTFDSILFLTGVLKPGDLLYSEKEIDYVEVLKQQQAEIAVTKGETK